MKKLLVLLLSVLTLSMVGCSSAPKEIDLAELETALNNEELLEDQSIGAFKLDSEEFKMSFPGLEDITADIEDGFALKAQIMTRLREVVVVKTENVDEVKSGLQAQLDMLKADQMWAGGYGGEDNVDALNNGLVGTKDNYVYYIVAPKAAEIEEKILSFFE